MSEDGRRWPGFGLADLAEWRAAKGVPVSDVARLERALAEPERPVGWGRGQRPGFYVGGLAALPWHDPAAHPWTRDLEDAWVDIRSEMVEVARRGLGAHPESRRLALAGRWQSFELYRMGQRRDENCAVCPLTTELVERIPGTDSAGLVYFSAMRPGAAIRPHCGPHNLRVRCHLGLHVRANCGIRVGGMRRTWEEGKCLVFDDSFVHEVWNRGTDARAVLLVDVWHPDLSTVEIEAITTLSRHYCTNGQSSSRER